MQNFAIKNVKTNLFWSNLDGWVSDGFDLFTLDESEYFGLPIDGKWVKFSNTMQYEVQHWTLCDSWINTWTVTDSEGNESPSYFPSHAQAQAALSEFLKEELIEYQNGNIESPYTSEEFRITPVTH